MNNLTSKKNILFILFSFQFIIVFLQIHAQTVHVLMPVFNTEQYLQDSIESALNQTYKDIRLIAYNDGSTDDSLKILEDHADRFKDTFVLLKAPCNRGISNARKQLLEHSLKLDSNAMLLWLDSDDCFTDTEFVEKFVCQMKKTGAEVCLFNFAIIFEDESQISNSNGLLMEQEASEQILNAIQKAASQTISPGDIPDLMNFTSLGWTKGYHQIKIPRPAECPYEDFAYMAVLLNASKITSFPADYKPIRYLRRAQSITGQRSAATFDAVLIQLKTFIDEVNASKRMEYYGMMKAFLERKIHQYENLLKQLISAQQYHDLTNETLDGYRVRAAQLLDYLMLTCKEDGKNQILPASDSNRIREKAPNLPEKKQSN